MVMSIGFGYAASVSNRYLGTTNKKLTLELAKLSAGRRVLSAKDDPAALAIGERLQAQVSAEQQAYTNAGQGSSMLQVADGGMSQVDNILNRMKSLSVEASSGQLSATDRQALNTEFQSLSSEVGRISADTNFAGRKLLDGSTSSVSIQVGSGTSPSADTVSAPLGNVSTSALGLSGLDIASQTSADTASAAISNAIDKVQQLRADNGASQNRLSYASANVATTIENTEAARSRLMDLDVAAASSKEAQLTTQFQAGIYASKQSNDAQKSILNLFT